MSLALSTDNLTSRAELERPLPTSRAAAEAVRERYGERKEPEARGDPGRRLLCRPARGGGGPRGTRAGGDGLRDRGARQRGGGRQQSGGETTAV
eukprot:6133771-Prymnesium_polylepis.2